MKFWVEPGTLDKMIKIGKRGQVELLEILKDAFGALPHTNKEPWTLTNVLFKVEKNKIELPAFPQVNILLGQEKGEGLKIFNDALTYFEKIK